MKQRKSLDLQSEIRKTVDMCHEMLKFLDQDGVVYSIRETGTGTNIHVELDSSLGEHPTFTLFRTHPIKKVVKVDYLTPPAPDYVNGNRKLPKKNIKKAVSVDTLALKNEINFIKGKEKSSSMEILSCKEKNKELKKTNDTETIDKKNIDSDRPMKVLRSASLCSMRNLIKRNSLVNSKESLVSVDENEEGLETVTNQTSDKFSW